MKPQAADLAEVLHVASRHLLHKAVRLLRASELGAAYEDAWATWSAAGDGDLWEPTAGDGPS